MANDRDYGAPPPKSNTLWWVLGGLFGGGLLLCCGGCGGCIGFAYYTNNQKEQRIANEPGISVSATKLANDYNTNFASANTQYGNQVVVVTGKYTGESLAGILLDNGVDCLHASIQSTEDMKALKVGQQVTCKGVCQGKIGNTVQVANARVVK